MSLSKDQQGNLVAVMVVSLGTHKQREEQRHTLEFTLLIGCPAGVMFVALALRD